MVDFVGPLYNLIYLATLEWYPGFAYCLSNMILIVMIVMTLYCRWYVINWSKFDANMNINTKDMNKDILQFWDSVTTNI